jgi:hypothetical protein
VETLRRELRELQDAFEKSQEAFEKQRIEKAASTFLCFWDLFDRDCWSQEGVDLKETINA